MILLSMQLSNDLIKRAIAERLMPAIHEGLAGLRGLRRQGITGLGSADLLSLRKANPIEYSRVMMHAGQEQLPTFMQTMAGPRGQLINRYAAIRRQLQPLAISPRGSARDIASFLTNKGVSGVTPSTARFAASAHPELMQQMNVPVRSILSKLPGAGRGNIYAQGARAQRYLQRRGVNMTPREITGFLR